MVDLTTNSANSGTIQTLIDLRAACVDNPAAAVLIDSLAGVLDEKIISRTDDAMRAHQYNDTARTFSRLISDNSCGMADILSPDALWLCVWLVRHICGFGQYVSFRTEDIASAVGWGITKAKKVVKECKDCGALVAVDASMSRSPVGTVYMIAPVLIDNSGKRSKKDLQSWFDYMHIDAASSDTPDELSRPVCWYMPINGQRIRVACVCMHENEKVVSIPEDTDEDFDPAFSDIDEIIMYNELHVTC